MAATPWSAALRRNVWAASAGPPLWPAASPRRPGRSSTGLISPRSWWQTPLVAAQPSRAAASSRTARLPARSGIFLIVPGGKLCGGGPLTPDDGIFTMTNLGGLPGLGSLGASFNAAAVGEAAVAGGAAATASAAPEAAAAEAVAGGEVTVMHFTDAAGVDAIVGGGKDPRVGALSLCQAR